MKKLFGLLLLILFVFTLLFSFSKNIQTSKAADSPGYASIIPIPPPEPPARRGC